MVETGDRLRERALDKLGVVKDKSNLTGQVIDGHWRLTMRIGHGAFGQVYQATDRNGEVVALKIFNNTFMRSGYLQELGLMFDENHDNIVKVLSFGYTSGRKYIVYEFVPGGSLRDHLVKMRRIRPRDALAIVIEVARALVFAHGRNVVHRDLKPENILLVEDEPPFSLKLCDFGLSARFNEGQRLNSSFGSPAYMAPEQFDGDYDYRVDFYAVGVILYEMLFGRRPYAGDATSIAYAQKHHQITFPVKSPPGLNGLLERMLAHDPNDRFQSAEELLTELEAMRSQLIENKPLKAPARAQLSLKQRWTASFPSAPTTFGVGDRDDLLFFAAGRLISAAPDGQFMELLRPNRTIESFASINSPNSPLVWRSRRTVQVLDGEDLLEWSLEEALGRPIQLIVSPTGKHIVGRTPHHVYLFSLDGERLWRAAVETYGALPPVCFSACGQMIWLATEAPRTQLLALGLDGTLKCRAASPGRNVDLCGADNGRVVVGSRGLDRLCLVELDGFISEEVSCSEELLSVKRIGDQIAVMSSGHIELFGCARLETRALVRIPSLQDMTLLTSTGIYQVGQRRDEFQIQFHAFTH